jgi:hypothetical protein
VALTLEVCPKRAGRKSTVQRLRKFSHLIGIVLALSFSAKAQSASPTYHPGDVIRISVTFDGPDSGKIDVVAIDFVVHKTSDDQQGFVTEMFPGNSEKTGPGAFVVSYKIPENQASGDYNLGQIRATFDRDAPVTKFYQSPDEFPGQTIRIENSRTVVKPKIKSVTVQ